MHALTFPPLAILAYVLARIFWKRSGKFLLRKKLLISLAVLGSSLIALALFLKLSDPLSELPLEKRAARSAWLLHLGILCGGSRNWTSRFTGLDHIGNVHLDLGDMALLECQTKVDVVTCRISVPE